MNLLITGAWKTDKIPLLEASGHAVRFMQWERDELPAAPDWVEGIICNGLFLYHPVSEFPNLRYIQLTSAGFDRVDMGEVARRNIEIHNARGVYSIPMAEYAVAGVLSVYKDLFRFRDNQKRRNWEKNRSIRELCGRTVAVIGCGSVGTECAKRFSAFGCRVVGVDIKPREDPFFDAMRGLDALDDVLSVSDVVILTLPLTEETAGIINGKRLDLMKSAVLVNISRGAVIEREALEKWKGEAVLDVFEEEPLGEDSPLWEQSLITPHNSFVGEGNDGRLEALILNNLEVAK